MTELADRWRSARPPVAGLHLDSGACSRQSLAVIDATAAHARHEAEVGGYVAAEAARPVLDAGRAAVGALTGFAATDVVYTTGANNGLDIVLRDWRGERTIACLPGEFGPSLLIMALNGFDVRLLPVDAAGRLDVDAATSYLETNPPALLHLTALGSHRGTVQPAMETAVMCRSAGVPLIVDAAQAFAHLDCAGIGADIVYSTSRKWTAGPRGVGWLATRPGWLSELALLRLAHGEVSVAAQVGLSVALGEHVAAGPERVRSRLAEVGAQTRAALAEVPGWRVIEPVDEPSAITTLVATDGADPRRVREWLIAERGIVTTCAEVQRAPFEMTAPVLRLSPHIDTGDDDLAAFAEALVAATSQA